MKVCLLALFCCNASGLLRRHVYGFSLQVGAKFFSDPPNSLEMPAEEVIR